MDFREERLAQYPALQRSISRSWVKSQKNARSIIDLHPIAQWFFNQGFDQALRCLDQNLELIKDKPRIRRVVDLLLSNNSGFWSARSQIFLAAYFQRRGHEVNLEPALHGTSGKKADIEVNLPTGTKFLVELVSPQAYINHRDAYSELDLWKVMQDSVKGLESVFVPHIQMYPYQTWLTKQQVIDACNTVRKILIENPSQPRPLEWKLQNGELLRIEFERQHVQRQPVFLTGSQATKDNHLTRNPLSPDELVGRAKEKITHQGFPSGIVFAFDFLLEKSDYYDLARTRTSNRFWSNFPWNELPIVAGLLFFWSDIDELEPSRRGFQSNPMFTGGSGSEELSKIWGATVPTD